MLAFITNIISNFRFADALDIGIITILLFYVLMWLRRRASRSAIIGITLVLLLYLLAREFDLFLTSYLFKAGLTAALLAMVLIFQEDIRMAIERITLVELFHSKHQLLASSKTIDVIIDSITSMARDKIGALMVIKGRESLDRHLSGGISLNGRMSTPLLYSIFHPETPSHDGAVIIEGERIEKFAVRLPLSRNLAEVGDAGTRHTAALGMAERSDAIVLVVSEEHGTISIAEHRKLERVSPQTLRLRLEEFYRTMFPAQKKLSNYRWVIQNMGIKITSIVLAILLWMLFAYKVETVNRTYPVPIAYRNIPQNFHLDVPNPAEVQVSLAGKNRVFNFDPASLIVSLDVNGLPEGYHTVTVEKENISLPPGLRLVQITPKNISVRIRKLQYFDALVKAPTEGKLSARYSLVDIKTHPGSVHLVTTRQSALSEIYTEPINLSKVSQNTTIRLPIIVPSGYQLTDESQNSARVTVVIKEKTKK